jgi:hypothetical protein
MAKRRARRSGRQNGNGARITSGGETARTLDATAESSMVPQVLLGAVNGIETVAVGALQLARNVLVSAVAGAADIGAEAVTATFAGTRGVVAAASRMVGDIATTAQSTLQETVSSARQSRGGVPGRMAVRRPLARMASGAGDPSAGGDSLLDRAATRRKATRPRVARQPRTTVAA